MLLVVAGGAILEYGTVLPLFRFVLGLAEGLHAFALDTQATVSISLALLLGAVWVASELQDIWQFKLGQRATTRERLSKAEYVLHQTFTLLYLALVFLCVSSLGQYVPQALTVWQ